MTDNTIPKEFTAMALIITSSKPRKALLVESRKHGFWMPPGGHVEEYENPLDTVIREAKEETGLDIAAYLPKPRRIDDQRTEVPLPMRFLEVKVTHGGKDHYHFDSMYKVELPQELPVVHDEIESSSIGWFTLDEISELNIPADLRPVLEAELAN